ncbi:MAG: hypothetical protein ACT4N5_06450 [Nitrosopumilaceae archaeon]
MTPTPIEITYALNCVIIYADMTTPKSGRSGNLSMFIGTLKGRSMLGALYRNKITDKLTMPKVMAIKNTEIFATVTIFSKKEKITAVII